MLQLHSPSSQSLAILVLVAFHRRQVSWSNFSQYAGHWVATAVCLMRHYSAMPFVGFLHCPWHFQINWKASTGNLILSDMCPRRETAPSASAGKRDERDTRRQEKKNREKKTYIKDNENSAAFDKQLRTFNLQLRDIAGDGNCLFRSCKWQGPTFSSDPPCFLSDVVSDQMDGNQQRHGFYREQICDFMRRNREDFEPFIVDQPFDAFMRSLAQDGTYGGNESVVAFSRLYDARICIHQVNFSNPVHELQLFWQDSSVFLSLSSSSWINPCGQFAFPILLNMKSTFPITITNITLRWES